MRVLLDGNALAREGGFVAHEGDALDEPAVRGGFVARLQKDDVADDQFVLRDVLHDAAAHDFDLRALLDLIELFKRLGAPPFHDDGQNDGHGDGDEDADAFDEVAVPRLHFFDDVDGDGDDPGKKEKDEHGFARRLKHAAEKALFLRPRKFVSSVLFRVGFDLLGREPRAPVRRELFKRLLRALFVVMQDRDLPFFRNKKYRRRLVSAPAAVDPCFLIP